MNLDLIILGELKRKSQYIGEMKRDLKSKNIHKVIPLKLETFYKKIKELEEKEYVIGEKKEKKGNDIIIYSITPKGVDYFEDMISLKTKYYETNVFISINDLIVNFEFVNKEERLKYFNNIKEEIKKKKQKLYENKNFVSYTDKMIFRQQAKIIKALEEWIIEEQNEILSEEN